MKEIKKRAFALITLLLCLPLAAAAQSFTFTYEGQTLTYNVLSEASKICNVVSSYPISVSGDVIIPAEANGYAVTEIGGAAFCNCSSLTSINIPNSVTYIGDNAFYGCSGLTSILVEDGNSYYSSIEGVLYDKQQTILIQFPIGKEGAFDIPSSVTEIGVGAFDGCWKLTSVNIPNSVTSIGNYAFYGCSGLTSINIPNSVTSIGDDAFRECSNLASASISNSVKSIGKTAFAYCYNLTSINIPNSVTFIGDGAFLRCSNLSHVNIPNSVTEIGQNTFGFCRSLKTIHVDDENPTYSSVYGRLYDKEQTQLICFPGGIMGAFKIPSSVTSIGDYAFCGCNVTHVTIPNSVTSIGRSVFPACSYLENIIVGDENPAYSSANGVLYNKQQTQLICFPAGKMGVFNIPSYVTSIEECAFYGCSGLTSVSIPNSVTSIGYWAFEGCSGLTTITLPKSVTSTGTGFNDCSKLQEIIILSPSYRSRKYFGYNTPNLQYIYAHKTVIDKWEKDTQDWDNTAQLIELSPIGTIADVLEKTDTKLSFRLKPTADDGSVVQTLYYKGKPIEADETGTYRLTGLYPYADIALSADVLRDGVQERAGFYLYAHSVILPVELRITEAGFATLMLPYDATLPEGVEAYATSQAKEATADGCRTLILEASDGLQANTPYIIKGQPGTYRFSGIAVNDRDTYTDGWLTGTFERVLADPGTYVLQNNGGVTGFYRVAAGKEPYVGANRAWLSVTDGEGSAAEVTAFVFSDGEATGIGSVAADRRVDVYTQEGVKVRSNVRMADALKALPRGIYIVDGVKKAVR